MEEIVQLRHSGVVRPPASVVFGLIVVLSVLGGGIYALCVLK